MLSPLATAADGVTFGYAGLTTPNLQRASTRIRGFLHQDITRRSSTVTGMGPSITLPQTPIQSITSVKDAAGGDVYYRQHGQVIATGRYIPLTVIYDHGLDVVPDEIIEITCAVAARMAVTVLAGPVTTDPYGDPVAPNQWQAQAGLTKGERVILRRYWPQIPRMYEMGATTETYPVSEHDFGERL